MSNYTVSTPLQFISDQYQTRLIVLHCETDQGQHPGVSGNDLHALITFNRQEC